MTRFFNLFDRFRIAEASAEAMNARSHSEQTRHEVNQLREQVDTLTITCQALCETLRDQLGVSEEEFVARLEEIDLRDGVADGKITRQPLACPQCGRKSNAKRNACLYCGERFRGAAISRGG